MGVDPLEDLGGAEGDFVEAVRLQPHGGVESLLGMVRILRADHRQAQGEWPLEDYEAAMGSFEGALRVDQSYVYAWVGKARAQTGRGVCRMNLGEDPLPDFAAAEQSFAKALGGNEGNLEGRIHRGRLRYHRGEAREGAGDLRQAARDYAAAIFDFLAVVRLEPAWAGEVKNDLARAQRKASSLECPR
jgi:tetratricopeptide (TPR) repeat protein